MMAEPSGPSAPPLHASAAARAVLADRLLRNMPQAMRERPQWLLWKFVSVPGKAKPLKMPFYALTMQPRGWPCGRPRDGKPTADQPQVPQGDALDRQHLVSLADAVDALRRRAVDGVGFAFLAGDGLIGIDIDHAIGADGAPSELCRLVVESCTSYTELSPSGKGVHVIVAGELPEKFKDDRIGLEVYAGSQYFTCTGVPAEGPAWPATPPLVQPADEAALAYMRELVAESKAVQQREREEAAALARQVAQQGQPAASDAAPSRPAPPPPMRPGAPVGTGGGVGGGAGHVPPLPSGADDFARVNAAGMAALHAWVPTLFPDYKTAGAGYRITSKALGRDLQEDLSIKPEGIVDFGVADMGDPREGRRTPIDLVMEHGHRVGVPADKPAAAMRWLAGVLGVQVSAPRLQRVAPVPPAARVPRPTEAEGDGPPGDEPPPLDDVPEGFGEAGSSRPQGGGEGSAPEGGAGDGDASGPDDSGDKWGGKKRSKHWWATARMVHARYALIYGTDTAWDDADMVMVRVPTLRLFWGSDIMKWWLAQPDRRWVRPVDLVFEPGVDVVPPQINMFGGLKVKPVPCEVDEVQPMLDLLRHLCAESAPTAEGVDAIVHWVLCWLALPLQQLGTKMATALVFHGPQGTGKNLFFDLCRDIYGEYGITVGQAEIEDSKNAWVSRKMFILADEVVSRAEMYHKKNTLKALVTQGDKFPIRSMYMDVRWERNCANLVFTSNEDQPLALEERDRRYAVIYTPLEADAELYQRVRDFQAEGGMGKWLHYLLTYELGDFTAHAKPPMTAAKEALIQLTWKPPEQFAHQWLGGELELPLQPCSREQLYRCFRRWCDLTGAKWPPDQGQFVRQVNRWVGERVKRGPDGRREAPALLYKPVQIPVEPGDKRRREKVMMFMPQGTGFEHMAPLPGVSEGDWALSAVESFEPKVKAFCRYWGRGGPDESEGGEAA